ncbi:MAG: hypothetical protein RR620_08685 [Clostridium sp.]
MKKILVEINEDSNNVCIINNINGKKTEKYISTEDFVNSIISSTERDKKVEFKPVMGTLYREKGFCKIIQTIQTGKNTYIYIILREKAQAPMPVGKRFYGNVGMPNLLFAVKVVNNRFSQLFLAAADTKNIKEDSKLFCYPFSHVSRGRASVCLGSNSISLDLSILDNLLLIPDLFFSMGNGLDSYSVQNNAQNLEFEALLRYCDNNEYSNDMLVENPTYKSYIEWIKSI